MSHINFAEGHQDNGQQMGPSHTSCVMYQTPTVIKFPAKHGYLLPSPIVGSRKKSRRSTGLERPTSKTKIYVLLFFDGISYFKLSKTSMNLHEFFKTPVNHYVSAPRRPRRPRYTFGMLYGKPLILQQTLTPPQGMSSPISGEWTIARIQTLKSFTPQHFSITLFWRNMR